ncbi:fimbrial protein [Dyella choica]|nr:fimbrial protein [Dyella choica]
MRSFTFTGLVLVMAICITPVAAIATDARIEVTGKIAASPCKVSVGQIQLGNVPMSSFQGPGQVADGGGQSTQLRLTNCPYGLSRIIYQIVPSNGAFDAPHGIAKLDARSTATGVAVQLTRHPSGVVPLNQDTAWNEYKPDDPNSGDNYITLRGYYYQTADTIREGSANASFTITFSFQ